MESTQSIRIVDKPFADQPSEVRMAARRIVDDAGGIVSGYSGGNLQVALPADPAKCTEISDKLAEIGLIGEDRFTWFPLGSDKPPESLRHFGIGTAACPRGDRPSYWKYRTFRMV